MKYITLALLFFSSLVCTSQADISDSILNEGKLLFRLEKGSWYGTDDMFARFTTKRDSLGGYLSYQNEEGRINTIFYSRFDTDKIPIRYVFDSIPKPTPITIDTLNLAATELEKNLITMVMDAQKRAHVNEDGFFSFYENAALNFIPLINGNGRAVYVITGPQISGVVLLGNDYKLTYNDKNEFVKKEKIHNTLLQFPYSSGNPENPTESTIHSHVVTEYISSTDICTLLLYKDYVEWKTHTVISKSQVSLFDMEKELLVILTREAWERIYNDDGDKK